MAAIPPIVFPPPPWTNQDLVLYHGTMDRFAAAIVRGPILTAKGRLNTDFGPGFYTTTNQRQAQTWAAQIAATRPPSNAAVIEIVVSREHLARLETLAFVRGDFNADDFWSLVHYCWMGGTDHARPRPARYYDVVYGPVAAFWNQRLILGQDIDQISFHTAPAEGVLNRAPRRRIN
jgi:uncharacterized protein DUF3990